MKLLYSIIFTFHFTCLLGQHQLIRTIDLDNNNGTESYAKHLYIDRDGFYWYATYGAIVKECGNSNYIIPYKHPRVANVGIHQILITKNNKLVAITTYGVLHINLETGKQDWLFLDLVNNINQKPLGFTSIIEDSNEMLWLGTDNYEIISYNDQTFKRIKLESLSQNSHFKVISETGKGTILIRNSNDWYSFNSGRLVPLFIAKNESHTLLGKTTLVVENGLYFPKNEDGTYTFESKSFNYYYLPQINSQLLEFPIRPYDPLVFERHYARNDGIWVNRENEILNYHFINNQPSKTLQLKKVIPLNSKIWSLNFENDHILATSKNELTIYSLTDQRNFNTPLNPINEELSIRGIYKNKKGVLFVNAQDYLYYSNNDTLPLQRLEIVDKYYDKKKTFRSYNHYVLNDSIFYLYGYTPNLIRLNIQTNTGLYLPENNRFPKAYSDLRDIEMIDEDHVLIGGANGLFEYDVNKHSLKDANQLTPNINLTNENITDIYYNTEANELWIGTEENGLYFKNASGKVSHFEYSNSDFPICDNYIHYVKEDSYGTIWVGTKNGLQSINKKTLKSQEATINIESNKKNIVGILEDSTNNTLWLSTYSGLLKYHKKTSLFSRYLIKDGLANNEFNRKSFFKENDSTFYFGGISGITKFNPKKIRDYTIENKLKLIKLSEFDYTTQIESSRLFNLDGLDSLLIANENKALKLEFAINNPSFSNKNRYQYKISELHNDTWQNLGSSNQINIQGLRPGDYNLSVRGINHIGSFTNELHFKIKSKVSFYKTTFFWIIIMFLVFATAVYIVYKRKVTEIKKLKDRTRLKLLEARSLQESMNPHFIFNSLNGVQFAFFNHGKLEGNEYLSCFSNVLRKTLHMNQLDYTTIFEEISYLKSYIHLKELSSQIKIRTNITVSEKIDEDQIKIPCLLLQPIVENAINHGLANKEGPKNLKIAFESPFKNVLTILVEDNGIGRNASSNLHNNKKHKSLSTEILKKRFKLYNDIKRGSFCFEIFDLEDNRIPAGTRIVITINKYNIKI